MIKVKRSKGIYLKLLNSLFFTILSILLVKFSNDLPIIQVLFSRVAFGAIFAFIVLRLIKTPISLRFSRQSFIFYSTRAITNFIALFTWVEAIKYLGMNEAMAFGYITPLWLICAAIIFFGEKLTLKTMIVVAANSIGIILILHPQIGNIEVKGLIFALFSTMLWATYDTICKKQAATEHYMVQCFYSFSFSALLIFPLAIYNWQPVSTTQIAEFACIGLIGVANVSVLFLAFVYTPIIVLIPVSYTRLLFTIIASYLLYDIKPTIECLIGAGIIVAAELYFYMSQKTTKIPREEEMI